MDKLCLGLFHMTLTWWYIDFFTFYCCFKHVCNEMFFKAHFINSHDTRFWIIMKVASVWNKVFSILICLRTLFGRVFFCFFEEGFGMTHEWIINFRYWAVNIYRENSSKFGTTNKILRRTRLLNFDMSFCYFYKLTNWCMTFSVETYLKRKKKRAKISKEDIFLDYMVLGDCKNDKV